MGCRPADTEIGESVLCHDLGITKIATIDNDGIAKGLLKAIKIEGTEFPPVGENEQTIGVFGGGVGIAHVREIGAGWKDFLSAFDCRRVIGSDGAAFGKKHLDYIDGRRLTDVIGLTLEGQAENADAFSSESPQG